MHVISRHHSYVTTHIANSRLDGGREKDEEAAKLLRTSSSPPSVDLEVRYCASVSRLLSHSESKALLNTFLRYCDATQARKDWGTKRGTSQSCRNRSNYVNASRNTANATLRRRSVFNQHWGQWHNPSVTTYVSRDEVIAYDNIFICLVHGKMKRRQNYTCWTFPVVGELSGLALR